MAFAVLLACILIIVCVLSRRASRRRRLSLPPGRKGWPIIGNLLDMPARFEWLTYQQWCKELNSDIIHLNVAGTSIIILDTYEAAVDLLEKRSAIYSSRPRFTMIREVMGLDFSVGLMPYGDIWRDHRRLFNREFLSSTVHQYHPHQRTAVRNLLCRLLNTPNNFTSHIEHMSGALLISVAYGIQVQAVHDPYLDALKQALETASVAAVPGAFLVDTFPILKYIPKWLPGVNFKRKAEEWKKNVHVFVDLPFEEAQRLIVSGNYLPSFTSYSMENADPSAPDAKHQEQMIKNVAGSFHIAGSGTLTAVLQTFILAMLSHPEIQQKAHDEIDRVILPGHLPDFDDEGSLSYVTAIVKEVLRWRPGSPIAVPHLLTTEDVYRGYRLPAKSIIIHNAWSMLHDEAIYPDPLAFKPERFMKEGHLDETVRDPAAIVFGFGRRICPARLLAYSTIWISVASILALFDITKAFDGEGNIMEPSHQYHPGVIHMPMPFECTIKPRHAESVKIIRSFME